MTMLSIRFDLRNPESSGVSMPDRYAACLEMCEWAERNGFVAVTLSEHHGSADGYLPSIFPMAAAIAARTNSLFLMLAAVVAPLHDPLRVAEDAAVLDNLSRGRLGMVIGGGYVPSEFAMFGVSPSDRPKRVVEAIETLRAAWTGEPFEFRGRPARITPKPFQPNGPLLMLGGNSEAVARRAARLGLGFLPSLPEFWEFYRDELVSRGAPDPGPPAPEMPMFLHVARDPQAAWEQVGPSVLYEMNAYGAWAAEANNATGYQAVENLDVLRSMGKHLVLTPDETVELARAQGGLMLHPMCGGLHPDLAWESLRLIESDVLPQLR